MRNCKYTGKFAFCVACLPCYRYVFRRDEHPQLPRDGESQERTGSMPQDESFPRIASEENVQSQQAISLSASGDVVFAGKVQTQEQCMLFGRLPAEIRKHIYELMYDLGRFKVHVVVDGGRLKQGLCVAGYNRHCMCNCHLHGTIFRNRQMQDTPTLVKDNTMLPRIYLLALPMLCRRV